MHRTLESSPIAIAKGFCVFSILGERIKETLFASGADTEPTLFPVKEKRAYRPAAGHRRRSAPLSHTADRNFQPSRALSLPTGANADRDPALSLSAERENLAFSTCRTHTRWDGSVLYRDTVKRFALCRHRAREGTGTPLRPEERVKLAQRTTAVPFLFSQRRLAAVTRSEQPAWGLSAHASRQTPIVPFLLRTVPSRRERERGDPLSLPAVSFHSWTRIRENGKVKPWPPPSRTPSGL